MSRERALKDRQRGVGIAAALFLLLIVAALVAFLVTMSGLQHSSSALDVQGQVA